MYTAESSGNGDKVNKGTAASLAFYLVGEGGAVMFPTDSVQPAARVDKHF